MQVLLIDTARGKHVSVCANSRLNLKKTVVARLEENDLDGVADIACSQRAVIGVLIRLAYDKNTLLGWRAILAMGRISDKYLSIDYEFLRATIRKLLWSLSDESGGIGWASPEILGEIVSADPGRLADIIPLIAEVYHVEEATFRPGVLYALKRIAEIRPEAVLPYRRLGFLGLSEADPLACIFAMELLGVLACIEPLPTEIIEVIKSKRSDKSIGWVYKNGGFVDIAVGEYADNFLKKRVM